MEDEKNLTTHDDLTELGEAVLGENDPHKLQSYLNLFNQNLQKRDVIRAGKLSALQDKVLEVMSDKVENHVDTFTNRDLLDYFKTFQDTLNRAPEKSEIKAFQVTQNQVNINVNDQELSKESADRIKNVVDAILKRYGNADEPQDNTIIDESYVEGEEADA